MKSMSQFHTVDYILPPSIRKTFKVGGPLSLIVWLGWTLLMLGVGIKQDTDKIPCFVVAGIFGIVFVGSLIVWRKNIYLIDAIYYADHSMATNCVDKEGIKVSVDLNSAMPIAYSHKFYISKGSFSVKYIVFSPNTLSDRTVSEFEGMGVYKVLRKIWASSSVIIPAPKDDSD